jgi:hypothetical protein
MNCTDHRHHGQRDGALSVVAEKPVDTPRAKRPASCNIYPA